MLKRYTPHCIFRLARDRRGVSAVEFAFLAPIMIGFYLGCTELADGVAVDRKVSLTAGALANLSAQVTSISSTEMSNILDAASAIVSPYDATKLTLVISCLKIDSTGAARVQWSAARNTTARAAGGSYTFDSTAAALDVQNSNLLLSEVTYAYKPTVGYTISGTLTLSDHMFMSPRITPPSYPDSAHPCS